MKMTDRNGVAIVEHSLVLYQVGTKHEALFTLKKDKRGILRFHFPNEDGYDMEGKSRSSAWYEAGDRKISEVVFDPCKHSPTCCETCNASTCDQSC